MQHDLAHGILLPGADAAPLRERPSYASESITPFGPWPDGPAVPNFHWVPQLTTTSACTALRRLAYQPYTVLVPHCLDGRECASWVVDTILTTALRRVAFCLPRILHGGG